MDKKILTYLLLLLLVAGCGRQRAFQPQPFPGVRVPGLYSGDREASVEYLMLHFWDGLTDTTRTFPCDSALVSGVKVEDVEINFAKFAGLLEIVDMNLAKASMRAMFGRIAMAERKDSSSNVFETLIRCAERYLYDPNSPLRNEDCYGALAEMLAGYGGFSPEKQSVYRHDAQMCSLNKVGTRATDFGFCEAGGREKTLYGIRAEYTLLFFSNPGCEACKEIIDVITGDPEISGLVDAGRLAVVNVYIDEDLEEWYGYMKTYPASWHNGYDPFGTVRADTLYNVRAIPSLYLLDRDKTVLLKDAPEEKIFEYLKNLSVKY